MKAEKGEIYLDDRRIAVTITRSKRRRRTMAFAMKDASTLTVTVPLKASLPSIEAVLRKHTGWIRRRLAVFTAASPVVAPLVQDGGCVIYLGRTYRLSVTHNQGEPQGCRLLPHRLRVNLHTTGLSPEDMQHEIRLEILLWLKKRARAKFQKRLDFWARRLGVDCRRLVVANAERRWGSCNAENVIRLNWKLMMAPLPVLDYVVVHELCHIRHKNHGSRFWAQVASVMPDYKALRKQLHVLGDGLVL